MKRVPAAIVAAALLAALAPGASAGTLSPALAPERMPKPKVSVPAIPVAIKVYVPNAGMGCFPEACAILWDRTSIEAYDTVYFWIRLPNGMIGSRDQVFGKMSNAKVNQDVFCGSGNCGAYRLPNGIELLPSEGRKYYFELFTMDQNHHGKSEVFTWK